MRVGCVVVAAGRGERLGAGPKAFVDLEGLPLVSWSVLALLAGGVQDVVLVLPADRCAEALPGCDGAVRVAGGSSRQESVRAGLAALDPQVDVVLVHDAARALVPAAVVSDVVAAVLDGHGAVVPAVPVTDTLRRVRPGGPVHRDELVAVQTPQGFVRALLERAHAGAGEVATDDATLVESLGEPVHVVAGHEEAFKVTGPLDLVLARALVVAREAS